MIAIENARLFQERETRNRDLSALHDVTAAASRSLEIKPVLDEVLEKITEIFKFDRVSIFLFDPKRETLTRMATFGIAQEETGRRAFRRGQGLTGGKWPRPVNTWSLRMSDRIPRYWQLSQTNSMQQLGACFFALFPIKAKERFLGTINCIGKEPPKTKARRNPADHFNVRSDRRGGREYQSLRRSQKKDHRSWKAPTRHCGKLWNNRPPPVRVLRVIASSPTELPTGSRYADRECCEAIRRYARGTSVKSTANVTGLSPITARAWKGSSFLRC